MALATDWQITVVNETSSFEDAIQTINKSGYQACLILDKNNKFLGILTDSDIRKALLRDKNLSESITSVMNPNPFIVPPELSSTEAERLMHLNQYLHLPIVNKSKELVGLHVLQQFKHQPKCEETLIIMAGGKGSRLMPLTRNLPKPMLPIQGKPILEYIIERAQSEGFIHIMISVNYLAQKIIDYFQNGEKFGVKIEYIDETKPLGTAGSIASLNTARKTKYMVVTNADLWTKASFKSILLEAKKLNTDGIMAVRHHEIQNPFGVISCINNQIISIEEKPITQFKVNAGIYVLSNKLVELLQPDQYCDMPELFSRGLASNLQLNSYMVKEDWVDIGRMQEYELLAKEN